MAPSEPDRVAASGQQHVVGHGSHELVVTEVGATIRSYSFHGEAVVDGFDASELCPSGHGQVLAPWPNRLGDGRYRFGDRNGRAALDEPDRGNAIHGLVRWIPWAVRSRAQNVLVMGCVVHPQPGYPWRIGLEIEYRLGRSGLVVTTEALNLDEEPAPFGLGFHPYLTVGTPTVDTVRLNLPAQRVLRTDERGLPVGEVPVGGELDFRTTRPVGPVELDTAYTDLVRDAEGTARVAMRHPDRARGVTLWMDRSFAYLMAYSADRVGPERRRRSMALEPMTCPPDALRSGTGLVTLVPGVPWRCVWGLSPEA